HLEIADFDTILEVPRSAVTPASGLQSVAQTNASPAPMPHSTRVHWDLFSADVEYSPAQVAVHRGVLVRGKAQVGIDGSAQLHNGNFSEQSPFAVTLHVRDA